MVVELSDLAVLARQVSRADMAVDSDRIADAQLGKRGRRADRMEKFASSVNSVGERGEVLVEFAICDRVEQQSLGIPGGPLLGFPPEWRLGVFAQVRPHGLDDGLDGGLIEPAIEPAPTAR